MWGETQEQALERMRSEPDYLEEDARRQQQHGTGFGGETVFVLLLLLFMFVGMFDAFVLRHFREDPTTTAPIIEEAVEVER